MDAKFGAYMEEFARKHSSSMEGDFGKLEKKINPASISELEYLYKVIQGTEKNAICGRGRVG
jgi:hypothetical protein